jgi:protein-S-isoprenylcysteine O-methyltransferase Ste14
MKVAALVFRFRVLVFVLLYLLGFFPPWEWGVRNGSNGTLWLAASTLFARSGWISLAEATVMVTAVAWASLVMGTILRVWGTAYLGHGVMRDAAMQGGRFVTAGPYRYLRNPLYLGAWWLACGASILMPPGGAGFFLIAFSIFVLFLISSEERFLTIKLGDAYVQYRRLVPRLLPHVSTVAIISAERPEWGQAAFAETYPIAFTVCFAIFSWRYNARVLIQCLLICYGLSLVVRAFMTRTAGLIGEGKISG